MEQKIAAKKESFIGRISFSRIVITLLVAGFVLLISHAYFAEAHNLRNEPFSFFATAGFIALMLLGRKTAVKWTSGGRPISRTRRRFIILALVFCFFLSFVFAALSEDAPLPIATFITAIPFSIVAVTTGMLIRIIRSGIRGNIQVAETRAEKSTSELRFLQSQLSPHFLFNTLNNMYGLSITQHEKLPAMILKLSDLLRYSVYDAKEVLVPLKNEIAYLKDYIEFEKIRVGEKLKGHIFLEEVTDSSIRIAPLLLIVFVENAFKHSKNTTDQEIQIDITLKTWNGEILFSCRNSVDRSAKDGPVLGKEGGLGLENVRKRLELQYPREYELDVQEGEKYFQVNLKLKYK